MTSTGKLRVSSLPSSTALITLHPPTHSPAHKIPPSMKNNVFLNHPELDRGQKKYLWSICSVYSTAQMKKLVQHQFMSQLFYEMEKGIVRSADWPKYIQYIANSSQRKYQFTDIDPRILQAPDDQFQFRYYRDHPVKTKTPRLPGYIRSEINAFTRPISVPIPRRYISSKRRKNFSAMKSTDKPFVPSRGEKSVAFILPPEGVSKTTDKQPKRPKSPVQVEGVTRPLSRIGRRIKK